MDFNEPSKKALRARRAGFWKTKRKLFATIVQTRRRTITDENGLTRTIRRIIFPNNESISSTTLASKKKLSTFSTSELRSVFDNLFLLSPNPFNRSKNSRKTIVHLEISDLFTRLLTLWQKCWELFLANRILKNYRYRLRCNYHFRYDAQRRYKSRTNYGIVRDEGWYYRSSWI